MEVVVLDIEEVAAEGVAVGYQDALVAGGVAVQFDRDGEVAVGDQALGAVALQGWGAGEDADSFAVAGFFRAALGRGRGASGRGSGVLRRGTVVETGSAAAVFGNPRAEYTRGLLAAVPAPDPERARVRDPRPLALGA
ncbi:hypothetical protein [Nocardia sp. NPDC020380]|uniref:ABC transporter ATP-binding protein n=1 Tax=Nocardia sp. NPDC020380 TaxID=3364309 RepID=UPI0037B2B74B